MKHLITTLALFCCMGCVSDHIPPTTNELMIYGHQVKDYSLNNKAQAISYLEEGSKSSFYSKGNIESDGNILTLHKSLWQSEEALTRDDKQTQSKISAYCPPLPKETTDWHQTDGQLLDLLISQTTCSSDQPIKLNFSHMFSKFVFHVDPELNAQLRTLTCSIIPDITNIEPFEATVITDYKRSYSIQFHADETDSYSILVPPVHGITLNIKIETTNGNILEKELSDLTCEKGTAYIYHIKEKKNSIGIYTAEDFIAFTYLINQQPYKNRSLEEFGSTKNGITTYYLRNNIRFTDNQRNQIQQIAYTLSDKDHKFFNDVFDGTGHQLENLFIKKRGTLFSALFPNVGKTGIIKNLTLNQVELIKDSYNSGIGILCSDNEGIIDNCHVRNAIVYPAQASAAAICTYNYGLVINCSAEMITFKNDTEKNYDFEFGGLVEYNANHILNCYTVHIKSINKEDELHESSAFCLRNAGTISNCYTDLYDKELHPICYSNERTINYCYTTTIKYTQANQFKEEITNDSPNIKTRKNFTTKQISSEKLVDKLNQWIINKAPQLYQNYTFLHWKMAPNSIVTFD